MKRLIATAMLALIGSTTAMAVPISWTDWQTAGENTVSGVLNVGAETVSVTYTGPYHFAQTGAGAETNYWTEPNPSLLPYTGSSLVDNAPPGNDIIALNPGGQKTIAFSDPVLDPLLALVSWNGNIVDFGVPIEILSFGAGFFGSGTPVLNSAGTGFSGFGEVHGVIRLPGTFTSITFTDTTELWHGFTVGVVGLADNGDNGVSVPEPGSLALFGAGVLGLAALRRRRFHQ